MAQIANVHHPALVNLIITFAGVEGKAYVNSRRCVSDTVRRGKQKSERLGFADRYKTILEQLSAGNISRRKAVQELGVGHATLKRLLDSNLNGVQLITHHTQSYVFQYVLARLS